MRVSVPWATLALLSMVTTLLAASPLQADQQQSEVQKPPAAATKPKPPHHIGITKTGGARSALSSGDCRNLGGTVVVVTDGRCGASGRYCHMNDGNAACIDTVDKPG
jgi:hypothetical protein